MSLETEVKNAENRMGDLGIFDTLSELDPLINAHHGSFRERIATTITPTFLGSCVSVGVVAGRIPGKVLERDGYTPAVRLAATFNLGTDTLTVCGVTKPSAMWDRNEVKELLYVKAQLNPRL